MKEKSEFQSIFDRVIQGQQAATNKTDTAQTLPKFEPIFSWDLQNLRFDIKNIQSNKIYPKPMKAVPKDTPKIEIKVKPIVREKRKWSAIQLKAINQFFIFGETLHADATDGEIKSAYRRLAKMLHPDRGGNGDEFREIVKAMKTLLPR